MPILRVPYSKIRDAFDYVGFGGYGENRAWLCLATGEFHFHTTFDDIEPEPPDDVEDEEKYIAFPHKMDFDLGSSLVMQFISEQLPDE